MSRSNSGTSGRIRGDTRGYAAITSYSGSLPRGAHVQRDDHDHRRAARRALCELVRNHLSGLDDFWLALERKSDYATAERLGLEFREDFPATS